MKLTLIISSLEPAIITIDNKKSFNYEKNEKICIQIDFFDIFYITVNTYSKHSKQCPNITTKFTYNNNLYANNFVTIIKHSNNIFELIFLNQSYDTKIHYLNSPEYPNLTFNIQGFNFNIFDKIKIKNTYHLNNYYSNPEIKNKNNCLILTSKSGIFYNICIIDEKNNVYEHKDCIYEYKDNELIIATPYRDYAKHFRVFTYELSSQIKLKETYTATNNINQKIYTNQYVLPYAFLINVFAKDFKEANKYLSENLKKSLKNEHLALFFGDFIQISVPKTQIKNAVTLIYHDKDNYYFTKHFSFEIIDQKINNINELN